MYPSNCFDETSFFNYFYYDQPEKTKIEHAIDDEMKKHHMNTSRTS